MRNVIYLRSEVNQSQLYYMYNVKARDILATALKWILNKQNRVIKSLRSHPSKHIITPTISVFLNHFRYRQSIES